MSSSRMTSPAKPSQAVGAEAGVRDAALSDYQIVAGGQSPVPQRQQQLDSIHSQSSSGIKDKSSAQEGDQTPSWSRIVINMVSTGIAAYFLASGMIQIAFFHFGVSLCGVTFTSGDPCADVTWLVSSCWLVGLTRCLLSICIGRPPSNRRVLPAPSGHRVYTEQLALLSFLPDVRPRSWDISVLDRSQLAAGIIHPGFYYRTLLVAWQEGLIITQWIVLHAIRLKMMSNRFSSAKIKALSERDQLLDEAFDAIGANSSSQPLFVLGQLIGHSQNITSVIARLRSMETVYKLTNHTCLFVSSTAAELFILEDHFQIALLAMALLLMPMLCRMLKFIVTKGL